MYMLMHSQVFYSNLILNFKSRLTFKNGKVSEFSIKSRIFLTDKQIHVMWMYSFWTLCICFCLCRASLPRYMKYLYPYECERKGLSSPGELQAAIDSNRREGRRPSYSSSLFRFSPSPSTAPHILSPPKMHLSALGAGTSGALNGLQASPGPSLKKGRSHVKIKKRLSKWVRVQFIKYGLDLKVLLP